MKEGKGVMESVSLSYARSEGYWGKIVGNMLVVSLCVALVTFCIGLVAGIFGFAMPFLAILIGAVVSQLSLAFSVIFLTKLALSVMQHKKA